MNEEQLVWKGQSSQITLLGTYLVSFIACFLILGVLVILRESIKPMAMWIGAVVAVAIFGGIAFVKWLQNRCRVFEVTTQRIRISQGVFSRRTDELELYRVKDMTLEEPFFQRIFGVGSVVLVTNDASNPRLVLEAVPQASTLREALRINVEKCRDQKKVRLAELE